MTMENSRVIEILNIVIDRIQYIVDHPEIPVISSGICSHISKLFYNNEITWEEKYYMRELIMHNKPNDKQFSKFLESKYWTGNTFWWLPISQNRETAPIRIAYLKALIRTIN